jgi:hypothetical protein
MVSQQAQGERYSMPWNGITIHMERVHGGLLGIGLQEHCFGSIERATELL